jgi:kynurenine formamidase
MFTTLVATALFLANQTSVDLTHTLSEKTVVYPGKTPFSKVICSYYESGYRLDDIHLSTGIGTHMDAPSHFCPEGSGIEAVPIEQCYGEACVVHLTSRVGTNADYAITKADLEEWESSHGPFPAHSIVLLHTGWDKHWDTIQFCQTDETGVSHFPGLSGDGAQLLVERKVSAVGIDTMGMDVGAATQFVAHNVLLGADIILIENLANLSLLPEVGSTVFLLPMKIKDAPESPVRAIAIFNKAKKN